jgi:methionine-rich copper-binding protein CopC
MRGHEDIGESSVTTNVERHAQERSAGRRRWTRAASGLILAIATSTVFTVSAMGHAIFISMSPADGSVVRTAPVEVILTFDEPVQDIGAVVVVRSPTGASVTVGRPAVVENTVRQQLASVTEAGTYSVAYRVLSDDGHPISQHLSFSLEKASVVSRPTESTSSWSGAAVLAAGALGLTLIGLTLLVRHRRHRRHRAEEQHRCEPGPTGP